MRTSTFVTHFARVIDYRVSSRATYLVLEDSIVVDLIVPWSQEKSRETVAFSQSVRCCITVAREIARSALVVISAHVSRLKKESHHLGSSILETSYFSSARMRIAEIGSTSEKGVALVMSRATNILRLRLMASALERLTAFREVICIKHSDDSTCHPHAGDHANCILHGKSKLKPSIITLERRSEMTQLVSARVLLLMTIFLIAVVKNCEALPTTAQNPKSWELAMASEGTVFNNDLDTVLFNEAIKEGLVADEKSNSNNWAVVDIPGTVIKSVQSFGNFLSRMFGYGVRR